MQTGISLNRDDYETRNEEDSRVENKIALR